MGRLKYLQGLIVRSQHSQKSLLTTIILSHEHQPLKKNSCPTNNKTTYNNNIMSDILFQTIERFQGSKPWGRLLDAGTGLHSVQWMQTLNTTAWAGITADVNMRNQILSDFTVAAKVRPEDQLLVGNWMDESFCTNLGQYDTILADYLIGAVDGFSPYEQDTIIKKLKNHLSPGGRLYFIGMNPVPDEFHGGAAVISEIRRARDACILLAGHRPYREFPLSWMTRHIDAAGFVVLEQKSFSILHSEESACRQIKVARSKLMLMQDLNLRNGMESYLNDLEKRTRETIRKNGGKIPLSFDYIISCEHKPQEIAASSVANTETADNVFCFQPNSTMSR